MNGAAPMIAVVPDATRRDHLRAHGGCHTGAEGCADCMTFVCTVCRLRIAQEDGVDDAAGVMVMCRPCFGNRLKEMGFIKTEPAPQPRLTRAVVHVATGVVAVVVGGAVMWLVERTMGKRHG